MTVPTYDASIAGLLGYFINSVLRTYEFVLAIGSTTAKGAGRVPASSLRRDPRSARIPAESHFSPWPSGELAETLEQLRDSRASLRKPLRLLSAKRHRIKFIPI